jgi:hypothetical protein
MLTMHRDALDRITAIYHYFSSFQKRHGAQIHHVTQTPPSYVALVLGSKERCHNRSRDL